MLDRGHLLFEVLVSDRCACAFVETAKECMIEIVRIEKGLPYGPLSTCRQLLDTSLRIPNFPNYHIFFAATGTIEKERCEQRKMSTL
jgi:hypothetical protein